MAKDLSVLYPGKVTIDANNPLGTFKNRTSDILKDGTPLEEAWQQDVWGFLSHLRNQTGQTPDGAQENEAASQYFEALKTFFASVEGGKKDLVMVNNSGAPTTQLDIDAGALILKDANGLTIKISSVNLTVDSISSGANGLDTGAVAADTKYTIYVIYNPDTQTTAGLLSINATSPTLPSGYTFFEPFGTVLTDGGSLLLGPVVKSPLSSVIWRMVNDEAVGTQRPLGAGGSDWAIANVTENEDFFGDSDLVSEVNGVFTFNKTGYYFILAVATASHANTSQLQFEITVDDGSGVAGTSAFSNTAGTTGQLTTCSAATLLKVTSLTQSFTLGQAINSGTLNCVGSAISNRTYFVLQRLGDI